MTYHDVLIGFLVMVIVAVVILVAAATGLAVRWVWRKARPQRQRSPRQPGGTQATPPAAKKPYYFKAHPWKTAGYTVLGLYVLAFTWGFLWKLLVDAPIAVANYHSQLVGLTEPPQTATPQGKWVGGAEGLRWSHDAKVNLRQQVTTEKSFNGRYFSGYTPPGSWTDFRFFSLAETEEATATYHLLENPEPNDFASEKLLQRGATNKHGVSGSVFPLPALRQGQAEIRMTNVTGLSRDMPIMAGYYVQTDCENTHMRIEKIDPDKTFQYELEVGSEAVQIVELPRSFKWLWIAPVHHECYQSRFFEASIPSSGISPKEAQRLVPHDGIYPTLSSEVNLTGEGYEVSLPFQAIILERDGVATVLSEAVLLQQSEVSGAPMSLRLNVPRSIKEVLTPAKIIVGIQL